MIIGLSNHSIPFTATGEVIIFDGFLKVYMESHDEETDDEQAGLLPALAPGDQLQRQLITAIEQYTLHPPRYTEASLVKKMEALGIGRLLPMPRRSQPYKTGATSSKNPGKASSVISNRSN